MVFLHLLIKNDCRQKGMVTPSVAAATKLMSVESCVMLNIRNTMSRMLPSPLLRPSMPSRMLNASVMYTTRSTVSGMPTYGESSQMPKSPCRLFIHRFVAGNMVAARRKASIFTSPRVPFRSSFSPVMNSIEHPTMICMMRMAVGSTFSRSSVMPSR